ncbi:F-box protein At5g49610-like [Typha latifolia]|uniref:F-box protein At5g49610-like n=1 Tax=Typha latifolia TaxID=4733 RepID=UPI003C2D674E
MADQNPIPEDLIVQILARLPIKTLLRSKCVCRSWSRLPSEKHFIDSHFGLSSKNPAVLIEILDRYLCVDQFGEVSSFSLDFMDDRVKIRASCNGLLCCASVPNRGVYYVCNPMTREFRLLPRARERPFTRFHPEYESTLVGLGFEPSTWNYNVVLAGFYRNFGHLSQDQLVCMVFDSKTNSWSRSVSSLFDGFTFMNRYQVVYANCSLNWLTQSCSYVLVLDLRKDVWGKISLPDEVLATTKGSRIYLLGFEDSVSVVQMSGVWMSTWLLKDHTVEQWCLVDRVHLRCINGYATSAFPVSQTKDVIFMATQNKILMYDRKGRVWKEVYAAKGNLAYPLWFSALAFRSSLFPCHQIAGFPWFQRSS